MGKIQIKVHKAKIELKSGETISEFVKSLSDAAREHVAKKMNLSTNESCYVDEVFSEYVVMIVYSDNGQTSYYAILYSRDIENDSYNFSNLTEVERKTLFVQKEPVSEVIKSICGDWIEKNIWKGLI